MRKFAYSMQNILNLQYKFEEQEKAAFREAILKLQNEEDILKQFIAQKNSYEEQLKQEVTGTVDLKTVLQYRKSIDVMRSRIRSQMIKVHLEEKNVESARVKLQQEMKKRKTHEVMREKALQDYMYEMAAEEAKEIDETVSYKHSTIN